MPGSQFVYMGVFSNDFAAVDVREELAAIADRKSTNSEGNTEYKKKNGCYFKSEKQIPGQNSLPLTNKFDRVLRGGDIPSKSEPNSALISSIVAVFEPSL